MNPANPPSTTSDATYHCPLCPASFAGFNECMRHVDAHPETEDIYLRLRSKLKELTEKVEIPFSSITPTELKLLKGDIMLDGDARVVKFSQKGNEWIMKLLYDKAMESLKVI